MKTKYKFFTSSQSRPFGAACAAVVTLLFSVLAVSAQTGDYLYSGSEQTITLGPGLYDITTYGAQGGGGFGSTSADGASGSGTGGGGSNGSGGGTGGSYGGGGGGGYNGNGGSFSNGGGGGGGSDGGGGGGGYSGGGGGGYSGGGGGGGGGGSIIDPSAILDLTEISGVASPDDSPNGEIIITAVPEPTTLAMAGLGGLSLLLFRRRQRK